MILSPVIPDSSVTGIGLKTKKIFNPAVVTKVVAPSVLGEIPLECGKCIEIGIRKTGLSLSHCYPEPRIDVTSRRQSG